MQFEKNNHQNEEVVLNSIKNIVFCGMLQIPKTVNCKNYLNTSDDEFYSDYELYTNWEKQIFYGLYKNDIGDIAFAIRNAKKNNKTTFPDFILNNGFIEHFKFTASRQNRKGSKQMQEQKFFEKQISPEQEEFKKYCDKNLQIGESIQKTWSRKSCEYSYENLVKSFKTNWENHIKKLENYKGNKTLKIFLVENNEFSIEMCEDIYENYPQNMRQGYGKKSEHFYMYRLSRDKDMLNYIYNYKDVLDYVIYYYGENVEIIKIENIPHLLKLLPYNYLKVGRNLEISNTLAATRCNFKLKGE